MNISLTTKPWVIWGISLASIFILTGAYSQYLLISLLLLLVFFYAGEKFVVFTSIALFLLFTKKEFSDSREVVTLLMISLTTVHFLVKYGLDFKNYHRIPKETLFFVIFLFSAVLFSNLFIPITFGNLVPLIRTLVFFVYCYYLYSYIKGQKEIKVLIYSLFFTQVFIAFFILRDFYNEGFNFFYSDGVLARFSGLIDNPNVAGLLTSISTNFILALFFSKKFVKRSRRILLCSLLLNNIIIMMFTDSRAATISTILGGSIILFTLNRKVFWISLTSVASIVLILFLIPSIEAILLILIRPSEFSIREPLWNSGIEMFRNHPISGVGPEKFQDHFYTYINSYALHFFEETGALKLNKVPSPHNFFLFMGAEIGIPGILASISIFVSYFYMAIKLMVWRLRIDHEDFLIVVALFAIGIGTLVRAFFEITGIFNYGFLSNDLPFWICIIILSFIFNKYRILSFPRKNEVLR